MTVREGEAYTLLMALRWMHQLGIDHVCFELDCKAVADRVSQEVFDHTEYGALIQAVQSILASHVDYRALFTSRQANGTAHTLARVAATTACNHIFNFMPCIVDIVLIAMH